MTSTRRTLLLLLGLFSLCGCSRDAETDGLKPPPNGGQPSTGGVLPGTIPGLVSLQVSPANHTLALPGTTEVRLDYAVTGTFDDGRTEDISTRVSLRLTDVRFGSFQGRTLVSQPSQGAQVKVVAEAGAVRGETGLTLVMAPRVDDAASTNLPADAATRFGGNVEPARAPELVYPNDGVLVPPNLGSLEFHFLPGSGNTLFELSFANALTDLRVFMRCAQPLNGGCIYVPSPAVWAWLAETNRGGEAVTVTLRGTDDTGTTVGVSAPLKLSVSKDDLRGGVYYWTTTTRSIMRWDFGSRTQTAPELFVDAKVTGNGTDCVGCHALSRDGKKMLVQAQGTLDGRLGLVDVATRTNLTPFPAGMSTRAIFTAWNPEGTRFVGAFNSLDNPAAADAAFELKVHDGTSAELVENVPGTGTRANPSTHPDWSADGKHIAYTRANGYARPAEPYLQWVANGAIWLVSRTADGLAWSPPVELVPSAPGKNRFYPAVSPDNRYLVFAESSCSVGSTGADCDSDNDPTSRLFATTLTPGGPRIPLERANAPGKRDGATSTLTTSYPKWSPFDFQRTSDTGSRLHWMTFSSSRAYGLHDPAGKVYLWMSAVDPGKLEGGEDPSFTAFALPFQDLATSNHIAQWTTEVVGSVIP